MNRYLPYGRQKVDIRDIYEVVKVLKSNYLTQGPVVTDFERAICKEVLSIHGIAVNSATSGLHIACKALGLEKGDYLWTTPITFVASANCGLYCGANIDFVDIDIKTGLMSIEKLEVKLKEAEKSGKLPKIVIPVHLCGTSCDMKKIKKLAQIYQFKIVEDASHAIGGKYNTKPVGSCEYSDACVFSFHPVKIITTGEGGIVTTNDDKLAANLRMLRSHGITKNREDFIEEDEGPWNYEQQYLGYNYRMTDIQAALGLSQLKKLKKIVDKRNNLLEIYKTILPKGNIDMIEIPYGVKSSVHLAIIKLKVENEKEHRNIFQKMLEKGIGVQLHYKPVHLQPFYKNRGFKRGDFENAEEYGRRAMSLPLFPELTMKDLLRVKGSLIESMEGIKSHI